MHPFCVMKLNIFVWVCLCVYTVTTIGAIATAATNQKRKSIKVVTCLFSFFFFFCFLLNALNVTAYIHMYGSDIFTFSAVIQRKWNSYETSWTQAYTEVFVCQVCSVLNFFKLLFISIDFCPLFRREKKTT